jgi:hypothetical protein
MSLRSRKFFDVLQHHPKSVLNSSRFRLPCPPYHTSDYWDRLYKDMSSEDTHEWFGFDLQTGLLNFQYERLFHYKDGSIRDIDKEETHSSTFAECMDIDQLSTPEEAIEIYKENQNNNINESILLLGCGNSKVGEQLMINSFVGPVIQLDISSKMIQLMTQRYQKYIEEASVIRMDFIVDDAKGLSSLIPDSIGGGILDKGLIDTLHCSTGMINDSDTTNPVRQVVDSAHKALGQSRPFIFFSRSEPEYIFRRALGTDLLTFDFEIQTKWKDIQVLRLTDLNILMYRFTKAEARKNEKWNKQRAMN